MLRSRASKLIITFISVLLLLAASSLAFSPDNSLIAIGGYGKVEIYRLRDGQFIRLFKTNHHSSSLTKKNDG